MLYSKYADITVSFVIHDVVMLMVRIVPPLTVRNTVTTILIPVIPFALLGHIVSMVGCGPADAIFAGVRGTIAPAGVAVD